MRNIELKVQHPNLAHARAAAVAFGARAVWNRPQRDTYFAVPGLRLKVREMPDAAELILYRRADGTRPRPSTYELLPLRDAAAAIALLRAVWLPAGVIEKTRELWMWRNVRIHLDRVAGLGTFVELEGVVAPPVDEARTRGHVDRVIAAMDLRACTAVPESYRDLGTRV